MQTMLYPLAREARQRCHMQTA